MCRNFLLVLIFSLAATGLRAQSMDWLRTLPASNQQQYLAAMQQMARLDESQLMKLAGELGPYGQSSNTPIQFALSGYADYVMKPGREDLRKTAVQAYGKALEKQTDPADKQFLVRRLQTMGKTDAVGFLSPGLQDAFLVHASAQALATIDGPEACMALRDALQVAPEGSRTALVQALGDCRDAQALSLITPLVQSTQPRLKKTALYALAQIGDPASTDILWEAARAVDFHYDSSGATADCLLYLRQLIANGHRQAAGRLVKKMQRHTKADTHPGVHEAVEGFDRRLHAKTAPSQPNKLTAAEKKDGFVSLFNGQNLKGWTGNIDGYQVKDGIIEVHPGHGSGGNLYTEKQYGDFVLRFSFQLTPGANNGIGIRAPLTGDAAYEGMEIQVLDNTAEKYAQLHLYQYHGSVYGVLPAKRGYLRPVGEWNEEEIRADGTRITVTLNGHVIVDGDIAPSIANGTLDQRQHPGLANKKGHIGFLGHGSVVRFRDLRLKVLR